MKSGRGEGASFEGAGALRAFGNDEWRDSAQCDSSRAKQSSSSGGFAVGSGRSLGSLAAQAANQLPCAEQRAGRGASERVSNPLCPYRIRRVPLLAALRVRSTALVVKQPRSGRTGNCSAGAKPVPTLSRGPSSFRNAHRGPAAECVATGPAVCSGPAKRRR